MPANAVGYAYGAGFVLATALLLATGVAIGSSAQRFAKLPVLRLAGAGIAVAGICLWAF